jgi:HPt (histidine-containing phosphotransfer) domain-containing protein
VSTIIIDEKALELLLTHLGGDSESRRRFVGDYVNLWDTRMERLIEALDADDREEAQTVLLSIRSSSAMVGAVVVEATASLIHSSIKKGDTAGCARHVQRLKEVGPVACRELATLFHLELADQE